MKKTKLSTSENKTKRYERKLYFPGLTPEDLEVLIKTHEFGFRETYYKRRINSVYYDTLDMVSYEDNIYGNSKRAKIRVRWYGEDETPNEKAKLEVKVKNGLTGFKIHDDPHNTSDEYIKAKFQNMVPVLKVSYLRQYFVSFDGRFRITIDSDITYFRIKSKDKFYKAYTELGCVLEIKYDSVYEQDADRIINKLPQRITKFSKYARGIEATLP